MNIMNLHRDVDAFTRGYIIASLWSSTDSEGEPLDKNYTWSRINEKTLARMIIDCKKFQQQSGAFNEQAGIDFWLTRNRHGAGFWDGDYQEPEATTLTNLAHSFGEVDLYVGDDGEIYQGGAE